MEPARRTALVTGSTTGIGLAVAAMLAGKGHRVVVNGLMPDEQGMALAAELASRFGAEVLFDSADVSDPLCVERMFAEARSRLGSIDILVNNAGIQHVSPVEQFAREQWDRVLAVNLSSVFWCSQQALSPMREQGWGRIVNIASAHGLVASPNKSAYVASKHGVLGLTKTIALETAGSGITCNAICPGWVRTPLAEAQVEARMSEERIAREEAEARLIAPRQPTGSFISPDEIAGMVDYLISDAAAQITGATLQIDGGWTAQ